MTDPQSYRPAPGTIPTEPGVYTFRDANNRVLYVGKAKNLRQRLNNYFQPLERLHPRTQHMVQEATQVRWTVVANEDEALNLEYTWIKRFSPRYNVMFRDDKTYPMVAVTHREKFPRVWVYRGPRRHGVRYFGPFPKVWAVRESLEMLQKVLPVRTCSKGVFHRHEMLGRPCLLGYIDKCSAPCVGRISEDEHRRMVDEVCAVFSGHSQPIIRQLTAQMMDAAEELDFERAAEYRDSIHAVETVAEKQTVVLSEDVDADFIGVHADELEAAVQIFTVRRGRIQGQRNWVVERGAEESLEALLTGFLMQYYTDEQERAQDYEVVSSPSRSGAGPDGTAAENNAALAGPAETLSIMGSLGAPSTSTSDAERGTGMGSEVPLISRLPIPHDIMVSQLPDEVDETSRYLAQLRGAQVEIRVPQRGDRRALMETVVRNAEEAMRQHKLKRTGDLTARTAALAGIQEALDLDQPPLRIECIDISHLAGTGVVASLVVFEDGLPKKADYRRYQIKEAAGEGHSDDVGSIREVVRRRFSRYIDGLNSGADGSVTAAEPSAARSSAGADSQSLGPATGNDDLDATKKVFAYPPNLFMVDGGAPQVNAAQEVLDELGVDVTVCGIAKRLEEVWLPGEEDPLIFPRRSEALYLIQRVRDEAHRFAITYQRSTRSAKLRASALDGIPGVGEKRKKDLLKAFGSVAKLKAASAEEIAQVQGIGSALAATIAEHLRDGEAPAGE